MVWEGFSEEVTREQMKPAKGTSKKAQPMAL